MRIGYNPHKDKPQDTSEYIHQVIIPVYIPNFDGYFKDSFEIVQRCLNSLFFTSHNKTFFTVVNNGSCKEIANYLNQLFQQQKIHEVIHTENIGKLNSVMKGLVGNNIKLVTISDSDVLFLENWQVETVAVFNAFPKAGVVGIVPQFRSYSHFCGNIIFDNLFSKKLVFTKVINPVALQNFYKSIGWDDDYNKAYLKWNLTLENKSKKAIVGSGHFVATYRKEIFDEVVAYHRYKMGADSEHYLDEIPLKKGMWRLTTLDNYAYHMGNIIENWMKEETEKLKNLQPHNLKLEDNNKAKRISKLEFYIKNKLFINLFKKRSLRNIFYKYKGLPKEEITKY